MQKNSRRVILSQYPNSNIVDENMLDHSEAASQEVDEKEKVQCSPNKSVQENNRENTVSSHPSRFQRPSRPDKVNDYASNSVFF